MDLMVFVGEGMAVERLVRAARKRAFKSPDLTGGGVGAREAIALEALVGLGDGASERIIVKSPLNGEGEASRFVVELERVRLGILLVLFADLTL
jgi:hypothetical protein